MSASTHESYLEQLGTAERPLTSSITPQQRRKPAWRGSKAIGVFSENDLNGLRGQYSGDSTTTKREMAMRPE